MSSAPVAASYDRVVERRRAVALARHFREVEGLSIAQIADRLGRSPATVKAYFYDPTGEKARAVKARYQGVCCGCGSDSQPRNGKGDAYAYCKACHPGAIEPRWTREQVLEAMRVWRKLHGRRDPDRFRDRILARSVERASATRAEQGLAPLPPITPHSLRRTWATFAAMIGRDPKWIAAQIGHTSPSFTFSVYQQVATRRYIDEQAVWTLMRFADEPAERGPSRQLTRAEGDERSRSARLEPGESDRAIERLNDADE